MGSLVNLSEINTQELLAARIALYIMHGKCSATWSDSFTSRITLRQLQEAAKHLANSEADGLPPYMKGVVERIVLHFESVKAPNISLDESVIVEWMKIKGGIPHLLLDHLSSFVLGG